MPPNHFVQIEIFGEASGRHSPILGEFLNASYLCIHPQQQVDLGWGQIGLAVMICGPSQE